MGEADPLVTVVPLASIGGGAFFLATVSTGRRVAHLAAGALCLTAVLAGRRWLHPELEWAVAVLVVASGAALARESLARRLSGLALPLLALGALAAQRALAPRWGAACSSASVAGVTVLPALIGLGARRLRERSWFVDLALFALVGGLCLIAGPAAVHGWQRAVVAAEGQEVASVFPRAVWPIVLSAVAFVAGLGWSALRSRLHSKKGSLRARH